MPILTLVPAHDPASLRPADAGNDPRLGRIERPALHGRAAAAQQLRESRLPGGYRSRKRAILGPRPSPRSHRRTGRTVRGEILPAGAFGRPPDTRGTRIF